MFIASAFSLLQSRPWLKMCELFFVTPFALVCLLSLIKGPNTFVFNNLVVLVISYVLRNIRGNNPRRNFIAALVLALELSILLGLPLWWACGLLVSFLAVDIVEQILIQQKNLLGYVGVNFALSPYERTSVSFLWSIMLQRLVESTYAIYHCSKAPIIPSLLSLYPTYSVEQHLQVVEIVSMSLLCVMLCTEVLVYAATKCINTCSHHTTANKSYITNGNNTNKSHASTKTLFYLRWALFSLVAAIYTHYILIPQLQHIHIPNLPLYILQLVLREGFYELVLCIHWVLLISITVVIGFYAGSKWHWPRTCSRKLFHFLVVAMFVPCLRICSKLAYNALYSSAITTNSTVSTVTKGLFIDYDGYQYRVFTFLVLALGVAVNIFVLFEYARLCLMPRTIPSTNTSTVAIPNLNPFIVVEHYMQLFLSSTTSTSNTTVNSTDLRGKLEISHISLLLGCAGPVWLFVVVLNTLQTSKLRTEEDRFSSSNTCSVTIPLMLLSIVPYVGLLTLGVGDACAAVMGKLFGKHTWSAIPTRSTANNNSHGVNGSTDSDLRCGVNSRTMEGSAACFISMIAFVMYVLYIQYTSLCNTSMFPAPVALWDVLIVMIVVCGLVTVAEAITMENDNIVLPVYACMLLLGSFILF